MNGEQQYPGMAGEMEEKGSSIIESELVQLREVVDTGLKMVEELEKKLFSVLSPRKGIPLPPPQTENKDVERKYSLFTDQIRSSRRGVHTILERLKGLASRLEV
ncbi:MAG: hypothetical protein OEY64_03075 [Nitrospinota bacterium]|nr:hypothetical protein [Nitrospinota bacterium]